MGVVGVRGYVRYMCMAYLDTGYVYNGYDVFCYFRYNKKIIKSFFFYRQPILSGFPQFLADSLISQIITGGGGGGGEVAPSKIKTIFS